MTSFIRTAPEKKRPKKEKIINPVNWDKLLTTNADVYAWIRVPGTNIDIPYYKHRLEKMMTFICTMILRKNTHLPDVSIPEEQTVKIYRTA